MPDENASPTPERPFGAFNFEVRIDRPDESLWKAAFRECSGLEATVETKTHREGGNNAIQYQLNGPITYGQLTLKRGMTSSFDLWTWFAESHQMEGYGKRSWVMVDVLDEVGEEVAVTFELANCVPVKLKAPGLNAQDGGLAIEEMQIAYERLKLKDPGSEQPDAESQ